MPTVYVAFCPLGEKCGRHGKRLGAFATRDDAISKTIHHLRNSVKHEAMDSDEAEALALAADYMEEEWDDNQVAPPTQVKPGKGSDGWGKGGGKSSGKDWGKGWQADGWDAGSWDKKSWREAPYPSQGQPSQGQPSQALVVHKMGAAASSDFAEAVQALTRAEVSARTASRVARAAALAFEEEATIIAGVLKKVSAQAEL